AGTYSSTQTVTLSTATGGATICYTIDASTPTASAGTCTHGTTYSSGFSVATTTTVEAIGSQSGLINSGLLTSVYTITAGAWDTTPIAHGSTAGNGASHLTSVGPLNCTGATSYF